MIFLKNLLCVFIFVLLNLSQSYADIIRVNSIEEINDNLIESLDKRNSLKTLVMVPLEGFIWRSLDPELNISNDEFDEIKFQLEKKIKLSKKDYKEELKLTEYEHKLSDPKIVDFFHNIQKHNAPLMVVTRNFSGSFNKIPHLEVWTWASLFEKGIDLSKSPIGSHQIIFNKAEQKTKGTYPTFYRGLLSCNCSERKNSPQGLIIHLLMNNLRWMPDVVYVVDKNEEYIKSIEHQFKAIKKDVQVMGFVYDPVNDQSDNVSSKDFTSFWEEFIRKLNLVSRAELKGKEDPYEQ